MLQLVALILAVAKAIPAIERMLGVLEEQRASARAKDLHHAIDDAINQARREAAVCPRADCPLLRSLRPPANADRGVSEAP
jgi:hypothetical protein